MNIGFSPDDAGILMIGGIAGIIVVPLLLAAIGLMARFLGWLFRIRSGWAIGAWWLLWLAALIVGPSLYLDFGAEQITGRVTEKRESVALRREGDWQSDYDAALEYQYRGKPGHVQLDMDERHFDALHEGETASLRIAPLYETIVLVRLATINTAEWLATPLRWAAIITLIAFLIWQAERIKSQRAWLTILFVALLLAIAIPSYLTYRAWQSADNLANRPLRAVATVTAVQRITNIDYFPCEGNCSDTIDTAFDVPQQYDVVQMTFRPANYSEAVLAVDSADAGSYVTYVGDSIAIAYNADDPRDAQIIGATHSYHWRNAIFFVWTTVAWMILLFAARFAFHWGVERFGQWTAARRL